MDAAKINERLLCTTDLLNNMDIVLIILIKNYFKINLFYYIHIDSIYIWSTFKITRYWKKTLLLY